MWFLFITIFSSLSLSLPLFIFFMSAVAIVGRWRIFKEKEITWLHMFAVARQL